MDKMVTSNFNTGEIMKRIVIVLARFSAIKSNDYPMRTLDIAKRCWLTGEQLQNKKYIMEAIHLLVHQKTSSNTDIFSLPSDDAITTSTSSFSSTSASTLFFSSTSPCWLAVSGCTTIVSSFTSSFSGLLAFVSTSPSPSLPLEHKGIELSAPISILLSWIT